MINSLVSLGSPLVTTFFIFLFLPISLIVYYQTSHKNRGTSLLIISVIFLALMVPKQALFLLAAVTTNYLFFTELKNHKNSLFIRQLLLEINIAFNIFSWIFFGLTQNILGYGYILGGAVIPFLATSANIIAYKNTLEQPVGVGEYFLYILFFPRLFVGPFDNINRFNIPKSSWEDIASNLYSGFREFILGGFQFIFIGLRLLGFSSLLLSFGDEDITKISAWLLVLAMGLGVYHTLGGALKVANSICRMFGIYTTRAATPDPKYRSVSDFVRRFNPSLVDSLMENIYNKKYEKLHTTIIKTLSYIFIPVVLALWLELSFPFFVFGLSLGVFSLVENLILNPRVHSEKNILRTAYTWAAVVVSFGVLTLATSGWSRSLFLGMVSFAVPIINSKTVFHLGSHWFIILLGLVFSGGLIRRSANYAKAAFPKTYKYLSTIVLAVLFVLLISLVI